MAAGLVPKKLQIATNYFCEPAGSHGVWTYDEPADAVSQQGTSLALVVVAPGEEAGTPASTEK